MGNLFSSILSTAGAMRAFQNGLSTVQNNVANASTPPAEAPMTTMSVPAVAAME